MKEEPLWDRMDLTTQYSDLTDYILLMEDCVIYESTKEVSQTGA
jgi:hypothetical protein